MSKVKDGNYIVIQSFMVKELELKGNELLIYAIVYGFSQASQKFSGSLQYLADWTNTSKQSVLKNLKSLCDKDLIEKFEIVKNGVKFCEYQTKPVNGIQKSLIPMQESLTGGIQKSLIGGIKESLTNNLDTDNLSKDNIEDNIDKGKSLSYDYDSFKDTYNIVCTSLSSARILTDKRKKAIKAFLKDFTLDQFREICIKANASRFLTGQNDRAWKADFDFLLRPDKAAKILEGGYDNNGDRKQEVNNVHSGGLDESKHLWHGRKLPSLTDGI